MKLFCVILLFLCFNLADVYAISYNADGPKYPGAEVFPLGRDGLDEAFESFYSVNLKSNDGPYLFTKVSDLVAAKSVKNLDKLIKDNVFFENITFFNMGELTWNVTPSSYSYQFYGDYNDGVVAERHWGQFGVKHQSFVANVSFTRVKDDEFVTCPAVGVIDVSSDTNDLPQMVNYNTVIIKEPFKFVGNRWNGAIKGKPFGYLIYVDPQCTGFDDPERDTTKMTSALDKSLGVEVAALTAKVMKEHYEKWVIEPHRNELIGSPRMNNSLFEPPVEEKTVVQSWYGDLWTGIKCFGPHSSATRECDTLG